MAVLVLVLDLYALLQILGSRAGALRALAWTGIVVLVPLVGVAAWWMFGPRPTRGAKTA